MFIIKIIGKTLISLIVFLLLFIMFLASVALISLGLLAVPLSLAVMTGFFTAVASDISPVSMFFAGVSGLSGGAALCAGAVKLFPKQARLFKTYRIRNHAEIQQ